MSTKRYTKHYYWCPNGCGKKVHFMRVGKQLKESYYICLKCNKRCKAAEVKELNNRLIIGNLAKGGYI